MKPDIVYMKFGSHLYGTATESSDVDYKGIYLPEFRELLLGNYDKCISQSTGDDKSKNGVGDVDVDIYALPEFIKFAVQGETFALDMLHAGDNLETTSGVWGNLVHHREGFYCKDMKAYIGYVRKQAAKYGVKGSRLADIKKVMNWLEPITPENLTLDEVFNTLGWCAPAGEYIKVVDHKTKCSGTQKFLEVNGRKYQTTNTVHYVLECLHKMYDSYGARAKQAEANEGIDWKAIHHALRAGFQARAIYKHCGFEYPLQETPFLMEVKLGNLDFKKDVEPVLEELVKEVEALAENSSFPKKVNRDFWEDWLIDVYDYEWDLRF